MAVSRRVRRLRISAPSEPLGRRGRILLEDALHTATMPSTEGGRLLLVRSLCLGVIHPYESPASIASRISELFRHLNVLAVHGDDPASAAAPAAYFHDPVEAYACFARRLARQEPLTSWVWPAVCPPWTPAVSRDDALRLMLTSSMQTPVGVAGALAVVRCLLKDQALAPMLAALRWQDGTDLLRVFGWSRSHVASCAPLTLVMTPVLRTLAGKANVHHWFETWGTEDARSLWLAAILLSLQWPTLLENSRTMSAAQEFIAAAMSQPAIQISRDPSAPSKSVSREPPTDALASSDAQPTDAGEETLAVETTKGNLFELTDRAGLLYLVQVLKVIGIGEWLASKPNPADQQLPVLLLREVAKRLETPPSDPVLRALEDGNQTDRLQLSSELQTEIKEWLKRARRFCRLRARIGLFDLVCRPGLISSSLTHLNITLPLRGIDPRVRRNGLDIDPGWVPWLGRVVKFHYVEGDLFHGH